LRIIVWSSSSRRQVRTQRSITAFIRGIRTPLNTTAIPASSRIVSNGVGYLPAIITASASALVAVIVFVANQGCAAAQSAAPGASAVWHGGAEPW